MFIYSWSYSSDSILTCHCKQRQASEVCAMGSFWLMVIVCACSMQHSMSCCKYWIEIAFHWKFIFFWPGALVGSCHSTIGNIQCSWFQSRTCNLPIRLLACTYIKYRISDFPMVLRCVALRCMVLCCVAFRCIALCCMALRCVALRFVSAPYAMYARSACQPLAAAAPSGT